MYTTKMAAPTETCRVCHNQLPAKSRRIIFGPTFNVFDQLSQVIGYVALQTDGKSKYVCGFCFTKLNKLSKIDFDLVTKLETLKNEKQKLVSELRDKYLTNMPQTQTPKSLKRTKPLQHTPTPRKSKKALWTTPSRSTHAVQTAPASTPKTSKPAITGVKVKLFTPSKIKVLYRIKDKVRSKVLREKGSIAMVKSIMYGKPGAAKCVYSALQQPIRKCVLRDIQKEISKLTSTLNLSLFRRIDHKNLTSFSFENIITEVKIWAPFFHNLISTLVKNSSIGEAVVSALILKFHNTHMTAFHHVIGQVLDHCGATDECIAVLNRLGVCVSTSAMSKMKSKLQDHQSKQIEDLLIKEKIELECNEPAHHAVEKQTDTRETQEAQLAVEKASVDLPDLLQQVISN
ncbi:uncharacterized protein LOC117337649 [Pecten maximus]|uniref:uncharacterized protein LOC117337649 n=1 Tax=Pecten maximus TaxID=6579 RepID=UPI0014585D3C|nr:uncharacterized protein LOC117330716 isoform X2 [Pecten maximus]XP_033754628.1 uncharacterized protein LOC117337649 [Pecten maximus]